MSTLHRGPASDDLGTTSIGRIVGAKLRAVQDQWRGGVGAAGAGPEATDRDPRLTGGAETSWPGVELESTVTTARSAIPRGDSAGNGRTTEEATGLAGDDVAAPSFSFLNPPRRSDAIGRVGTYDILGLLGQGGMGLVFRGYDSALHRVVAVKVLAPRLAAGRRARRQFLREARSAAAINHPNVVTIHAVDVQRGMPYLVMECIPGRSLRDRVAQGPRLSPGEVLRISLQIASGLAAAHAQGVIHRDVKPANIMLEDQVERVKLTDFGLALAGLQNSELTSLETIVGTPAYMSPEQVRGAVLDPRSDLFSLGCVMYAMLAGHSPFQGAHALDTIRRVTDEAPTPLRDLVPDVPPALADLVAKLLSKDPGKRPASAAEVAEAIRRQLAERNRRHDPLVLETTSTIPIADLRRRERRRRLLGNALNVIAALALTVAILALAVAGLLPRPAPAPPARNGGEPQPRVATPDPPAAPGLVLLTAADGSTATSRGLEAALRLATPGSTLKLLDEGTYAGPIDVDDPARLRGLTIEGRPGAVLAAPAFVDAVVAVADVPDVTLRDLELRSGAGQFGLKVRGEVPGLLVEGVRFRKPARSDDDRFWAHAWLAESARGTAEAPIRFRGASFADWPTGLVLQGTYGPVEHVVVEGCRFEGIALRQVELIAPVQDVRISGCLFVDGRDGIFLDNLGHSGDSGRIEVRNNSFLGIERWVNATTSRPEVEGMVFSGNAIFGARAIDVRGGPMTLAGLRDGGWRFEHNLWESPGAVEDAEPAPLATPLPDLGVVSRDPDDRLDFLRPAPGSPLLGAGAGGAWPDHAGARPPGDE